jgi:hypothetical protein
MDLISKQQGGIIAKFDMHSFDILKEEQPAAAISLYNRLMRMKSYELIYERKNNDYQKEKMEETWQNMNLMDSDLLIDIKLGSKKDV